MYWPYSDIDVSEFINRIHTAEELLVKNGAVYVKDHTETKSWMLQDGTFHTCEDTQKVFQYMEEFIRIDKVFFTDRPCIVLEFSKDIDGPYEDADPFPYDLEMDVFEQEITFSMCINKIKKQQQ